jgi:hypothetical protein
VCPTKCSLREREGGKKKTPPCMPKLSQQHLEEKIRTHAHMLLLPEKIRANAHKLVYILGITIMYYYVN